MSVSASPTPEPARPRLVELHVADLALVSSLRLELGGGLTVLCGETGAGKSMLVDALLAATGRRVGSDLIREGAKRARVDAAFSPLGAIGEWLSEAELELDGEESLLLGREIQEGRAPARLNGRMVSLSQLSTLGSRLVAVHGQHEQLRLGEPGVQRELLDLFGGYPALTGAYRVAWHTLVELEKERTALGGDPRARARRTELLAHEVEEIEAAALTPQSALKLTEAIKLARSSAKIQQALAEASGAIGDDERGRDQLGVAREALRGIAGFSPALGELEGRLVTLLGQLSDLHDEIVSVGESLESGEDLVSLEAEADALDRLKRKYGASVEEILQYGERAASELRELRAAESRLATLDVETKVASDAVATAAAALRAARTEAATRLTRAVEGELADLGLGNCRFSVELLQIEPESHGSERVRFLIAPNPGEPSGALNEIASGGELSRIMLALEVVLARHERTPVLVFDEVDTGVGGRLGEVLGRKLWSLARHHQVLCVSHLPQLAAYADVTVRVRKEVRAGRTFVVAEPLTPADGTEELAAMLGDPARPENQAAAAALARAALEWKALASLPNAPRISSATKAASAPTSAATATSAPAPRATPVAKVNAKVKKPAR